ncbi:MAG: hypothetical protein L0G99_13530, partial [Propionibacteriales bacterium]|nr:hypothetical protein [Propionibacteriales bacterium]
VGVGEVGEVEQLLADQSADLDQIAAPSTPVSAAGDPVTEDGAADDGDSADDDDNEPTIQMPPFGAKESP